MPRAAATSLPLPTAEPMLESDPPNPLLLFACVRPELENAIGQELRASHLRVVVTSNPLDIREVASEQVIAAVVLDSRLEGPTSAELAAAFASGLPAETAFVLLVEELAVETTPPFDAVVRIPCGPGVLRDVVMRTLGLRWAEFGGPERAMSAELAERAERMAAQTHYEVLGLADDVPVDLVVAAFDRLSMRLHPERLAANGVSSDLANEVYSRICEAYRALRSPGTREAYDLQLRAATPESAANTRPSTTALPLEELSTHPIARRHLRIAQQALAVRDFAMAIAQVRFAASKDLDNVLIPAQLAQLEERLKGATEHG
ncbi:MAG: DnaJ domain-containing protein [Deltaproteobacteria bacterium]|nr:DnaJ domain-containing protein [Deltaproteobacteria bacterium]